MNFNSNNMQEDTSVDDDNKKDNCENIINQQAESKCSGCSATFTDFVSLTMHSCRPFRCSTCSADFVFDYELDMHKKNNHELTCSICERKFLTLRNKDPYCRSCKSIIVKNHKDNDLRVKSDSDTSSRRTLQAKITNCEGSFKLNNLSKISETYKNNVVSHQSIELIQPSSNTKSCVLESINTKRKRATMLNTPMPLKRKELNPEEHKNKKSLILSKTKQNKTLHTCRNSSKRSFVISNTNQTDSSLNSVQVKYLKADSKNSFKETFVKSKDFINTQKELKISDIKVTGKKLNTKITSYFASSEKNIKSDNPSFELLDKRHTSNKVKDSSIQITAKLELDMVPIDSLIRSLPLDENCGILLQSGKEYSNFECAKCFKSFRTSKQGSIHYSSCKRKKFKKTLVYLNDVRWLCILCHTLFNHDSGLTKHRNYCLWGEKVSLKKSTSGSVLGREYKSAYMVCPKCSYRCRSAINFRNHPCPKLLRYMQSCFVFLDRVPGLDVNTEGNVLYYTCNHCEFSLMDEYFMHQHVQAHSKEQLNEGYRTLCVNVNGRNTPILKIKIEPMSINHSFNNREQTNTQASTRYDDSTSSLVDHIYLPVNSAQASCSWDDGSFAIPTELTSSISDPAYHPETDLSSFHACNTSASTTQTVLNGSSGEASYFENQSSACSTSGASSDKYNLSSLNQEVCRCRRVSVAPEEDIKPCLKCLSEIRLNHMTSSFQSNTFTYARIKQELEEETATADTDTLCFNPSSINIDLDLSLGYENNSDAFHLMQALRRNFTPPSSVAGLTPPATPDSLNIQSPSSHAPAQNESICASLQGNEHTNEKASVPVGSPLVSEPQCPNELASLTIDHPFPTSSELMELVPENGPSTFQPQTDSSDKVETQQPPEMLSLSTTTNIVHVWNVEGHITVDAWAIVPSEDCEIVEKYLCGDCFEPFEQSTLANHLYSEHGRTLSEILAEYVVESEVDDRSFNLPTCSLN